MSERSVLYELEKESRKKIGIVHLTDFLFTIPDYLLDQIIVETRSLAIIDPNLKRNQKIEVLYETLYERHQKDKDSHTKYKSVLTFIGNQILGSKFHNENWKLGLEVHEKFDFFSISQMISVFTDFCADIGITSYDIRQLEEFDFDLFLTKRDPLLKTETVFIRTGFDLERVFDEAFLESVVNARKYSDWILLVTTSHAIIELGLNRLIDYMNHLKVWLYIIDPFEKQIYGITKGSKSKEIDSKLQENLISKLPERPIRSPSPLAKFSKFGFSEKDSYKSGNFMDYDIRAIDTNYSYHTLEPIYSKIFSQLVLTGKNSGLKMFSLGNTKMQVDESLISAFFNAMDSFVSELAGASGLEQINYKNFSVYGTSGNYLKFIIFLIQPASAELKDRLNFLTDSFEETFQIEIEMFQKNGSYPPNMDKDFEHFIRKILSI